ncbi:hypothetical protein EMIT013CA1_80161 [Bacillus sp. IT-13CA1]
MLFEHLINSIFFSSVNRSINSLDSNYSGFLFYRPILYGKAGRDPKNVSSYFRHIKANIPVYNNENIPYDYEVNRNHYYLEV